MPIGVIIFFVAAIGMCIAGGASHVYMAYDLHQTNVTLREKIQQEPLRGHSASKEE